MQLLGIATSSCEFVADGYVPVADVLDGGGGADGGDECEEGGGEVHGCWLVVVEVEG